MKRLVIPVIIIWIAGAFLASIYYDVQRTANCIEQEGFVKGLWCKTDPITRIEFSSNRVELLVKGLSWPVRILPQRFG